MVQTLESRRYRRLSGGDEGRGWRWTVVWDWHTIVNLTRRLPRVRGTWTSGRTAASGGRTRWDWEPATAIPPCDESGAWSGSGCRRYRSRRRRHHPPGRWSTRCTNPHTSPIDRCRYHRSNYRLNLVSLRHKKKKKNSFSIENDSKTSVSDTTIPNPSHAWRSFPPVVKTISFSEFYRYKRTT